MIEKKLSYCLGMILLLLAMTLEAAQPEEQKIDLGNGIHLSYAEHGKPGGTTLILLHGFTDSWHSFEHVLTQFPDNFRVFAITQRGHGNSTKPVDQLSLSDFSSDIAQFIHKLSLGPCIIAGHSLGGLITQQFALDYPQLTKGIVLINTAANFADNPGIPEFLESVKQLTEPVPYTFAEEFQKGTVHKPIEKERMNLFISESLKVPAKVWSGIAGTILTADFSKSLHKIKVPALILWGDQDSMCPRKDQEALASGLKNATLIEYQQAGHALHWEDGDRFARDVTGFIHRFK